jgi:hypothetical protein
LPAFLFGEGKRISAGGSWRDTGATGQQFVLLSVDGGTVSSWGEHACQGVEWLSLKVAAQASQDLLPGGYGLLCCRRWRWQGGTAHVLLGDAFPHLAQHSANGKV